MQPRPKEKRNYGGTMSAILALPLAIFAYKCGEFRKDMKHGVKGASTGFTTCLMFTIGYFCLLLMV